MLVVMMLFLLLLLPLLTVESSTDLTLMFGEEATKNDGNEEDDIENDENEEEGRGGRGRGQLCRLSLAVVAVCHLSGEDPRTSRRQAAQDRRKIGAQYVIVTVTAVRPVK